MKIPKDAEGRPRQDARTAENTHNGRKTSRPAAIPTVLSAAVYTPEPGRVTSLVAVPHECGRTHVHRTRSLEPFTRRALCGTGRYVVVPVVADVPFGTDYADTQDWCDTDGVVHRGGEGQVAA